LFQNFWTINVENRQHFGALCKTVRRTGSQTTIPTIRSVRWKALLLPYPHHYFSTALLLDAPLGRRLYILIILWVLYYALHICTTYYICTRYRYYIIIYRYTYYGSIAFFRWTKSVPVKPVIQQVCVLYIQLLFIVLNDSDLFDHFLHLSASTALPRHTWHCTIAVLTIQRCHWSVPIKAIIHAVGIYSYLYLRVISAGLVRYSL